MKQFDETLSSSSFRTIVFFLFFLLFDVGSVTLQRISAFFFASVDQLPKSPRAFSNFAFFVSSLFWTGEGRNFSSFSFSTFRGCRRRRRRCCCDGVGSTSTASSANRRTPDPPFFRWTVKMPNRLSFKRKMLPAD